MFPYQQPFRMWGWGTFTVSHRYLLRRTRRYLVTGGLTGRYQIAVT